MKDEFEGWGLVKGSGEILICVSANDDPEPNEPEYWVWQRLIVAWRIPNTAQGWPLPVVPESGTLDPTGDAQFSVWGILTTRGVVIDFDGGEEYPSVEEFAKAHIQQVTRLAKKFAEKHAAR